MLAVSRLTTCLSAASMSDHNAETSALYDLGERGRYKRRYRCAPEAIVVAGRDWLLLVSRDAI